MRTHFSNIRKALESPLLRNDFGPIDMEGDESGAFGMTLRKFDAKIIAISSQQAVRGLRYKQYRPDYVIVDDPQDLQGTRTKENRDRIYSWFVSEIIPLGTTKTKIFLIGNFLHEFSLLGRVIEQIKKGERGGVFRRYPLVDDEGVCQWPEKFKTPEALEAFKRKIGDDTTWRREFLLQTVTSDERVIQAEWIKHWVVLPKEKIKKVVIGVDLAISEKETADYTGIVVGLFAGFGKDFHGYVIKTINRRMAFLETMELLKELHDMYTKLCGAVEIRIEDVAYQRSAIEYLEKSKHCRVIGVKIATDKHARLMTASALIQNGTILFAPDPENSHLKQQLIGFGIERFDDLCDAFTLMANSVIGENGQLPVIGRLNLDTGKVEIMGRSRNTEPLPTDSYSVNLPDLLGNLQVWGLAPRSTPPPPNTGDNSADSTHRPAALGPSPRNGPSETSDGSPSASAPPSPTPSNSSGSGDVILPSGNAYRPSYWRPRPK